MRADRLLSIMLLLHARKRMTADELATHLEVSERTIYRDVDALSGAGVPVYTRSGINGGIFLDEGYRISLTGLSQEQVLSLFASAEAGPLADIGLDRAVEDSLLKLFAALPQRHQHEVERMRQRFHIDPSGWFQRRNATAYVDDLQRAVWQDCRVQLTYQTVEHGIHSVTVDAYALVNKSDVWYMVGRKQSGDYRTYRLTRIHELTVLDEVFERDESFDLRDYWRASRQQFQAQMAQLFPPYPVRLRVHPQMFWYFGSFLEGRFQQVGDPDEQGWLTVQVEFGAMEEARMHVMALGDAVTVITPEALKQHVLAQVRVLLQQYGSS